MIRTLLNLTLHRRARDVLRQLQPRHRNTRYNLSPTRGSRQHARASRLAAPPQSYYHIAPSQSYYHIAPL